VQNENRGKAAENIFIHLKTQFKTTDGFLHFSLKILMNLLLTRDMKSDSSKNFESAKYFLGGNLN
jgi:hypothetical protein